MFRKIAASQIAETEISPGNGELVVERLPLNISGRDFVVGDLHGHLELLFFLLDFVEFDKKRDRLFSTGDLADRGVQNIECLRLIDEPWFFSVRGNHEEILLELIENGPVPRLSNWLQTDGAWTKSAPLGLLKKMETKLRAVPHLIIVGEHESTERFHIVHAELMRSDDGVLSNEWLDCLESGMIFPEQCTRFMWGRTLLRMPPHKWLEYQDPALSKTFCGHSIVKEPTTRGKHVFVDTGAFTEKGALCIVDIREEIFFMAKKQEIVSSGKIDWERLDENLHEAPPPLIDVPF